MPSEYLQKTQERLRATISPLSDEQWKYKPAAGGWSIAECIEHVVVVEQTALGRVEGAIAQGPCTEHSAVADDFIMEKVPARLTKFEAPEFAKPSGRWETKAEALSEFDQIRAKTRALAARTDVPFRQCVAPHPRFGNLDAHQWLLIMGSHCLRHLKQIDEIQADPGFPK